MMGDEAVKIAVLEERVRGLDKALLLQASEYERRLDELNHAHAQQVERNAQYVSRELWDSRNKEVDDWRRAVDNRLSRNVGIAIGVSAVAGLAVSLIVQVLR